MTDRDDALRRELGWTGPEETDYEPPTAEPEPPSAPSLPCLPGLLLSLSHPIVAEPVQTRRRAHDHASRPMAAAARAPSRPARRPTRGPGSRSSTRSGQAAVSASRLPATAPTRCAPRHRTLALREPPRQHRMESAAWLAATAATATCRQTRSANPVVGPTGAIVAAPALRTRAASAPPAAAARSYADRIRADDLVPARRVPPGRGWRLALYKATFGLVNLGQSPDEIRQAELEARSSRRCAATTKSA